MIHVNSVLMALRDVIAGSAPLTSSAYPIEIGVGLERFEDRAYFITIWPVALDPLEPRTTTGPHPWQADVDIAVWHGFYTAAFSGEHVNELMIAQAHILTTVNSDKNLGGAVQMTELIGSHLLGADERVDEHFLVNEIRFRFSVRSS